MKKVKATVEEILHKPFEPKDGQTIPDYKIKEGETIPIFSQSVLESLMDFKQFANELMQKEDVIVFWGFSGKLQNRFSVVKDENVLKSPDTLQTTLKANYPNQPFVLYRASSFRVAIEKLGGIQGLTSIDFSQAELIIQGKMQPPEAEYEEPEEEEFDDDCLPSCRPGDHKCGKK